MYKGERFNSISHLAAAVAAVAGVSVLLTMAGTRGDVWKIVSFSVYGAMMILLFTCSTLYHSFRGPAKELFQKLDHAAIYLMIAGSYTPFALVTIRGPLGWVLFGIVWGLALFGIFQELLLSRKSRRLSLVLYLIMGWLAMLAAVPIFRGLDWGGSSLLVSGGLLYTIGVYFYLNDHRLAHGHGIWHLFVAGGSACQFFCVMFFVA